MIIYLSDIARHDGEQVTVRGWVHQKRSSGKVQFLIVRDGTGYLQAVVARSAVPPEQFEAASALSHESALTVTGVVRSDARAPGGYELDVSALEVVHLVSKDQPFPITPKEHGIDFLLDQRAPVAPTPRQLAIIRVRHADRKGRSRLLRRRGVHAMRFPDPDTIGLRRRRGLFTVPYFERRLYFANRPALR